MVSTPRRVTPLAPIKRIIVPATFQKDGAWNHKPAVFELGVGSCGLTVTKLEATLAKSGGAFLVRQTCSDGSRKTFVYPFGQLTGRVEVER